MAGMTLARKLIEAHLVDGEMTPGSEIALRVDQTLTQDATGTLVMLELEALGLKRVRTEVSVQYVDHNLLQADERNMADHLFLRSAAQRFGLWFSPPGGGVSHPVHMQRFGISGKSLIGSDSHTCAAGSLGMLAIGVGGLEVALAMAGEPLYLTMPKVWGVRLSGKLPAWVSAKDVVLEMLRRHGVKGGVHRIIEYHGPGVARLSAMDRHVIANMGAELGATATVFPSDDRVREFLRSEGREDAYVALEADPDAEYDLTHEIDLGSLEPLIAKPSSPGSVVPVRKVAGTEVHQVVVGSSANPGLRDFAIVAAILRDRRADAHVSLDVNPTSREILADLTKSGATLNLIRDQVWLCSPETAAAAALTGCITDPRELGFDYPALELPESATTDVAVLEHPLPPGLAQQVELVKAESIGTLPELDPLPERLDIPVVLKAGDDVSTDEILQAGAAALSYRSDIARLAEFSFTRLDPTYPRRAREAGDHVVIGGENYGQGSSREHAALAPRSLGLRVVIAKSFARIHASNLVNFGVLPLEFADPADYDAVQPGDELQLDELSRHLADGEFTVSNLSQDTTFRVRHRLSPRQIATILAGGRIAEHLSGSGSGS